jgi:catechol 2,3-dioxygenase-like lactoylglutathione lyase family enzyme
MVWLDHLGLVVRDLAAEAARFRRLGFTLTRRADHTRPGPDGTLVPAGSSQHSIMFDEGYLELLAITDPTAGHPLTGAADRYEGVHIIALGVADAEAAYRRLDQLGAAGTPPVRWQRTVDEAGARGVAEFTFFAVPANRTPEGLVIFVQHHSPELIRPPATRQHANGATRLRGVTLLADQPEATARRYAAWCDAGLRRQGERWTVSLGEQAIVVAPTPATWPEGARVSEIAIEGTAPDRAREVVLPWPLTLRFLSASGG